MFENGEATDVVNENHKGDAPRRVSQHSSLFGCGVTESKGDAARYGTRWMKGQAVQLRTIQPPQPSKLQKSLNG